MPAAASAASALDAAMVLLHRIGQTGLTSCFNWLPAPVHCTRVRVQGYHRLVKRATLGLGCEQGFCCFYVPLQKSIESTRLPSRSQHISNTCPFDSGFIYARCPLFPQAWLSALRVERIALPSRRTVSCRVKLEASCTRKNSTTSRRPPQAVQQDLKYNVGWQPQ